MNRAMWRVKVSLSRSLSHSLSLSLSWGKRPRYLLIILIGSRLHRERSVQCRRGFEKG